MSDKLFDIPVTPPSELDIARARFHSAQDAFHLAQDAEDEYAHPIPREIRTEFHESALELARLEKLEISRRRDA